MLSLMVETEAGVVANFIYLIKRNKNKKIKLPFSAPSRLSP